jgi:hypothetical protein
MRLYVELKIYDKNRQKITGPQCVKIVAYMYAHFASTSITWICIILLMSAVGECVSMLENNFSGYST